MILVSGVSGSLGGLILAGLSSRAPVAGGSRSGDGATVRRVDFDDPATLATAFAGVQVLVFVSAGFAEDDVVLARHGAVVDAAADCGVRHVIYTSLAGTAELTSIALPHRWTEARLAAAPFGVTILRNGIYAEFPAGVARAAAPTAAQTGVFAAAWGDGKLSVVPRQDLADVAVRVAAETWEDLAAGDRSRHAGRIYELEGVTAVGGHDIAEMLGAAAGRPVRYQKISLAEARAALAHSGLPPYQIGHTLSTFANLGAGRLDASSSDLPRLLPAPPRSALELIAQAIGGTAG